MSEPSKEAMERAGTLVIVEDVDNGAYNSVTVAGVKRFTGAMLSKSQQDAQTIVEAIARAIDAAVMDERAHYEGALQAIKQVVDDGLMVKIKWAKAWKQAAKKQRAIKNFERRNQDKWRADLARMMDIAIDEESAKEKARLAVLQPCGHPAACIVSTGEGTNYCGWCEDVAIKVAQEQHDTLLAILSKKLECDHLEVLQNPDTFGCLVCEEVERVKAEAWRDMRHACAEAVTDPDLYKDCARVEIASIAHRKAMNARVRSK